MCQSSIRPLQALLRQAGVDLEAADLVYPSAPLSCSPSVSSDNLLLVLLDTRRHDMLTPEVMPNLYRYANQPGWFRVREHISGGNSTKAGVFCLFYGLPVTYGDAFLASGLYRDNFLYLVIKTCLVSQQGVGNCWRVTAGFGVMITAST